VTGEFARIAALTASLPPGEGVVVGPGDDAAVLRPRPGFDLVATTDTFVEGRHFEVASLTPEAVGRRLAAANLSDLAAMAAVPRWALFSAVVPESAPPAWLEAVEGACARTLASEGATVVGGNLASAPGPIALTVTLLGEVAPGRHWTRAGARPGDVLVVSGEPGLAASVLRRAGVPGAWAVAEVPAADLTRFLAPVPRVVLAQALAATGGVRAGVDLSDGLAGDAAQLARASGVGVVIEQGALVRGTDALRPGDDYELLLAVEPARLESLLAAAARAGAALTRIGRCTGATGAHLLERVDGSLEPLPAGGWDHFG
jgi:thiamine-monophosphate kinase